MYVFTASEATFPSLLFSVSWTGEVRFSHQKCHFSPGVGFVYQQYGNNGVGSTFPSQLSHLTELVSSFSFTDPRLPKKKLFEL